jgi:hypothetical protein
VTRLFRRTLAVLLTALACASLPACQKGAAYVRDAAADSKGGSADASADAPVDAPPAASADALAESPVDAPAESPADALAEARADAPPEASSPPSDGGGNDTTPVGRAQGDACTSSTQCASGPCVDGFCCSGACTSKCNACANAFTGKPNGTCAPVQAAKAHGNDCEAQAAGTCGTTGTCDGAGACTKWAVNTVCVAQSCPAGSATQTAASTCNASGACVGGAQTACGVYKCNATTATCRTTCSVDGDCVTDQFCIGGTCKKKPDGQICASNPECASGTCAGRCCPSGTSCNCPQPSPANLLANPGFDVDYSGWTTTAPSGSSDLRMDPADATSCPWSESIYVYHFGFDTAPTFSECVPVSASKTYNFGGMMTNYNCGNAWCDVHWYNGSSCGGVETGSYGEFTGTGPAWQSVSAGPLTPPADAVSAKVVCASAPPPPPNADCWTNWDMLYLSPAPATY